MTMTANLRAPWTVGSTPPTLPLQRGGKRRPFFLGSPLVGSPSFCQRITEPLQSPTLVPDLIGDPVKEWIQSSKGSSVFAVGPCSWSSYPRDPIAAPPHGACGRGCAPVPNSIWGRGLSERSEFRSPNNRDRGKGTRRPRPGAHGFGSFCRNKRACPEQSEGTSSCGAETPQIFPLNPD